MNSLKQLVRSVFSFLRLFSPNGETRKEAFDVVILSRLRMLTEDLGTFKTGAALSTAKPQRVILFSHFDSRSIIDPYVQYYLDFLSNDLDAFFFIVSTSAEINNPTDILNHPRCLGLVTRANYGLDFSSWKTGYKTLKAQGVDFTSLSSLTLANDSCFGPLFSLKKYFDMLEGDKAPLMGGATESFSFARHVQSYFVVLNGAALQTGFLARFFSSVRPIASKSALIMRYEVGMGVLAARFGIHLKPMLSAEQASLVLSRESNHPYFEFSGANSTVLHWDVLLRNQLSPFLKRSVFLEQPSDFAPPQFLEWKSAVAGFSHYPINLIESYAQVFGQRSTFTKEPVKNNTQS